MGSRHKLFTSESVTEGHPDKIADQISDGVLDAIIAKDTRCRVACEVLVTTGLAVVAGEITTNTYVDIPQIVRQTIAGIGYDSHETGFSAGQIGVLVTLGRQSPDIAAGTQEKDGKEQGAGDQGLMFGYATNETTSYMPSPIHYAHMLTLALSNARRQGVVPWLRPDGKTQVTIEYDDRKPVRIDTVVLAAHHAGGMKHADIKKTLWEKVVKPTFPSGLLDERTKYHCNETGAFEIGGPVADTGLTGRKIIVDTYGGWAPHGGGAFSGKDPSKVDRSACYAARWLAKNIVAAGFADECLIQVAYAIGVAKPVSVFVDTKGTNKIPEERIEKAVDAVVDLRPKKIIERLDLLRPIYQKTAAHGHFGRDDPDFTWEKLDIVDPLKKALS